MGKGAAVSPYGARNSAAPAELDAFSFLVGKWRGVARTRLDNGSYSEHEITWIGRYVLDGMAIVDEGYGGPGDAPPLGGYSIRYFDPHAKFWVIEFVNVASSFVRRQVNSRTGSVDADGAAITVTAEDDTTISREYYRLSGKDRFVYSIDLSRDGGKSWDTGSFEMTLTRVD